MKVSPVSKWMCCALLAVLVGGFGNLALGQGGGGDAPPLLEREEDATAAGRTDCSSEDLR